MEYLKQAKSHIIAILVFIVITAVYFSPQLSGKVIPQGDIIKGEAMAHETRTYAKELGRAVLWTNSMFVGMPTYQISTPQKKNVLRVLDKAFKLFIKGPIGLFFLGMLMFYIMLSVLGCTSWLSIIGAVAFSFMTYHFTLYDAGHNSKIRSVFYFAPIVAGFILTYRKQFLGGASLFALGLGLNLFTNHPQMTYMLFICLLILFFLEMVKAFKTKSQSVFWKGTLYLFIGTVLAIGSSASKLWTTYEYSKDTMRGDPILEMEKGKTPTSSSETDGLEWQYAMQWSNTFMDVGSIIIPSFVGGSSSQKIKSGSVLHQDRNWRAQLNATGDRAPTYWGGLIFTSGPAYLGAIMIFLFILSMFTLKGNMRWWGLTVVLLTIFWSMGRHFGLINQLFFDYFPLFNKFRAPSAMLAMTGFFIPMFGMLGLHEFLKEMKAKERLKALRNAGAISIGICLMYIIIGLNSSMTGISDGPAINAGMIEPLIAMRKSMIMSDGFRTIMLILLSAGILFGFIKDKIQQKWAILGLGLLILFDVVGVGKRYINADSFVESRQKEQYGAPRPVDLEIMKDTDPHYRVLDMSINPFEDSRSSKFHKTIGGYHPAKLQRFEDVKVKHLAQSNTSVLRMLNTKYVISQDQKVQRFPNPAGNAWFVSELSWVENANAEIDALGDGFEPLRQAIVHNEFKDNLNNLQPTGTGSINLTNYLPDELTYTSTTNAEEFAVFSEAWYGPNKGWQAYIDGEKADHVRVNYMLRGLRIPAGTHEIKFVFDPVSFKVGEMVSLLSSLIILLGMLAFLYFQFKNRPEKVLVEEKSSAKKRKKK